MEEAEILVRLFKNSKGTTALQKPEKIYLNNSNLMHLLTENVNIGNTRETFFMNHLKEKHKIEVSDKSDFLVNDKFTFEIGSKNKNTNQIIGIRDSYIVSDNIELGYQNKIPLWIFGFLY